MIVIDVVYFSVLLIFMAALAIILILSVPKKNFWLLAECISYLIILICFYASLYSLQRVEKVPLYQFVIMLMFAFYGLARVIYVGSMNRSFKNEAKKAN